MFFTCRELPLRRPRKTCSTIPNFSSGTRRLNIIKFSKRKTGLWKRILSSAKGNSERRRFQRCSIRTFMRLFEEFNKNSGVKIPCPEFSRVLI